MRWCACIGIFSYLVCGYNTNGGDAVASRSVELEAYEIYSEILRNEWSGSDRGFEKLLILDETVSWPMCLTPEDDVRRKVEPAIAEYLQKRKTKWKLERRFNITRQYQLIPAADVQELFESRSLAGGWNAFYARYPGSGGYLAFSAVGFNEDKTIAVVYVQRACGALCGSGRLGVFQRVSGKWEAFQSKGCVCSWVS